MNSQDFRERAREAVDVLASGIDEEESINYINELLQEFYEAGSLDTAFEDLDDDSVY